MSAQAEESRRRSSTPAHDPRATQARSSPASRSSSADTALLERPVIAPTTTVSEQRRRGRGPTDVDPRPGHIHGLDGLRAIAIIGVLVFHFTPNTLPAGFIGVDVFFVLSGFLITTLLLREISRQGRIDLPQFWLRRARRLLPALVTVVVLSVAAARLVGGDLLVNIGRQALGAMTFSTNWLEVAAGASYFHSTSPLLFINFWSLAVEEQFYLLWPIGLVVLLAVTRTAKQRIGFVLALALASAMAMAVLFSPDEDSTRIYYGTDTHLFGLMLGVALAFAWAAPHRAGLRTAAWRRWRMPAVGVALLVLVGLMALLSEGNPWTFRGGLLLACLATVVLIAGLLESGSPWRTMMSLAPLRWIGERSYGIYLWHWAVLMIVATLFPYAEGTVRGALTLTGALVLTLVLSELSFRFIETPVRRDGFRASFGAVRQRMVGAGTLTSRVVAGSTATLLLLAAVAIATAPEKSQTQQAIETAEAQLNGSAPDVSARAGLLGGVSLGMPTPQAAPAAADGDTTDGQTTDGAQTDGDTAGEAGAAGEVTGDSAADGFAQAMGGLVDAGTAAAQEQADSDSKDADQDGHEAGGQPEADAPHAPGAIPDGWHEDDEGLLVPDSGRLTAIGDSLVVTSADGLKWRFPEMNFAAKSNRQWKDANPVLASALAQGEVRDNVIVHFGTNAGVDGEALRTFLDTLGPDRQVVVMNLYGSSTFIPDSNETIEKVVADYPNAVVGDWQATIAEQPGVLQSDRVHPDIEGMHVYAAVVARAFDELARTGG
ncbi:acyltransferase family protein [Ornithinimicrobium cryptoxanthini]|uniref:Acyltransferase n=1 Tax=Ornithinimicrobium cryptoxanthini TaxID=2934161 RepID=A0ABY4YHY6_9MICO|nr:acyltransferase family protein [Ornithinimicrobium cryptoxanthini]USQ76374.1 acyltransferase [Ornithinimicrobium cryptoxanthini]